MAKQGAIASTTVTITTGQSLSSAALLGGSIVGISFGATWDAAGVSFVASADNSTFVTVTNTTGSEITFNGSGGALASTYMQVLGTQLTSMQYVKVRSGTSAAPINQTTGGTDRTITLYYRIP